MKVLIADSNEKLLDNFTNALQTALDDVASKNVVTIGLSGGSLIQSFASIFEKIKFDWEKVKFFFCDERKVDVNSADSTFGEYKRNFLSKVSSITEKQFVVIDQNLSVDQCAVDYEQKLKSTGVELSADGKFPLFDVALLGLGPDGHTCSLFPDHALLNEKDRWIAPISDSPKPPPERITVTIPVLNHTRYVIFVVTGESKAKALHEIIEANQARPLPGGRIHPKSGKLFWILDKGAASELINKF